MKIHSWIGGTLLSVLIAAPVGAHPVTYVGTFSTAGEAVLNPPSQGVGSVTVVFDDDTFTMAVQATFSGLTGLTTASHIHCCTTNPDVGSAGVATPVPNFPEFPLNVQAGSYQRTFDLTQASSWNPAYITANGGTSSSAFAALSTGLSTGKAYWNIHTEAARGGEIRAFLHAAPVPEPATWLSMAAGLALIAGASRRRRA